MTTCKFRLHGLFSLEFAAHKLPCLCFDISLKGFRSLDVDLATATRFHQHLIIDLVPIDTCGIRRLQNLSDLTGITHKSSKSLQNIFRVFLLYLGVLDWNPKHFRRLRPNLKFCRNWFTAILDWSSFIEIELFFLQLEYSWDLTCSTLSNV